MPTLVIMAAGLGSRYGGDKQIDGVGPAGETLLEYSMFDARRAGFDRVRFIIRRELTPAFDELIARLAPHIQAGYAIQDIADVPSWAPARVGGKPWGTAHAVLAARHAVAEPFAVINADDFYGADAYQHAWAAAARAAADGTYTIVGFPIAGTLSPHGPVTRGLCECEGDLLVALEEARDVERTAAGIHATLSGGTRTLTGREIASMNFWVFAPAVFGQLERRFHAFLRASGAAPGAEALLPNEIGALVSAGEARVRVVASDGQWFGMTHAADRDAVRGALAELTRAGVYPTPLWGGALEG